MKENESKDEKSLFNLWLKEVNKESRENPIIVEGKKDAKCLRSLGITGLIFTMGGKSISDLTDSLSKYNRVIILTDFDKEGKKIKNKIVKHLQEIGVKTDLRFYYKIRKIVKSKVRVIEGLESFLIKNGIFV